MRTARTIACGRSEAHHEETSPSGWGRVVGGKDVRRSLPRARHASVFAYTSPHNPSLHPLLAGTRYVASGQNSVPLVSSSDFTPSDDLNRYLGLGDPLRNSVGFGWTWGKGRGREGDGYSEGGPMYLKLKINLSMRVINAVHTVQPRTLGLLQNSGEDDARRWASTSGKSTLIKTKS